ncbi:MAG: tetratricopeptide repeat protein [Nitrospinae bacterium]|nr:tetratricopeptide repeat protein [Nitrospinota bacterium]
MTDEDIHKITGLVSERTGLRVATGDGARLRKTVLERMRLRRLSSAEHYLRLLESDASESRVELDALGSALMVGESYFFRDKGKFQLIRERLLPELAERWKSRKTLGIWSAGCACGEEAYSLAITVREALPDLADWKIRIVGTDSNEEFLDKARGGVYGAWSLRSAPAGTIGKYFEEKDGQFSLVSGIKNMVEFRKGDLRKDPFPAPVGLPGEADLILCRNVFIYYERAAVADMVQKLSRTLREGGYLLTGHWELFSTPSELLTPRMFPESLAYQRVREGAKAPEPSFQAPYRPAVLAEKGPDLPAAIFSPPVSTPAKEDLETIYSRAEKYFLGGDYGKAIDALYAVLDENPRHFRGLCLAANALANAGEHAKARERLNRAVKAGPLSPEPYYLLARIAEEEGDSASAVESLKKAIYLEPSSVAAYLELAAIYENAREFEKARKARQSALSLLTALPKDEVVAPYAETAGKMILMVEKLLA